MDRYRHEYKYMVNRIDAEILEIKAEGILERDPHITSNGAYLIRSLYFDDYNNQCMFDNECGVDIRSKFRIRYYNNDCKYIRLEKKSKMHGMTIKESCMLSPDECSLLINGQIPEYQSDMPKEKEKLFLEMQLRNLVPKIIVSYERIPFLYSAGNVRITFDRGIASSTDIYHFLEGNYFSRPIMEQGYSIMEVKWDEILPLHIKNIMQLDHLQWTSFSKYYMSRTFHL